MTTRTLSLLAFALCASCVASEPLPPRCADGVVEGEERCDDGNTIAGDYCTECQPAECGNGRIELAETCDDGGTESGDGCSASCAVEECGDGIIQAPEQCDDGNFVDCDACANTCTIPGCGDGTRQSGEQCDDGNADDGDACSNTCTSPICGDGILQRASEGCDDGNSVDDDGCPSTCQLAPCGNGVLDPGEACDDGNDDTTDACTNACELATCGDGVVWAGVEECEPDDTGGIGECLPGCVLNVCGDGLNVDCRRADMCDDGNLVREDFCDDMCRPRCVASDWDGFDQADLVRVRGSSSCVLSSASPATAEEARAACETLGDSSGRLTPQVSEVASAHAREMGVLDVWVWVDDLEREGEWFAFGETRMGGGLWALNQPDDGGEEGEEDCVAVAAEPVDPRYGTWSDEACDSRRAFTCVVALP